jgi:hypothetical protein
LRGECSRQAVRKWLQGLGVVTFPGNRRVETYEADALEKVPRLVAAASRLGFRGVAAMVSQQDPVWRPEGRDGRPIDGGEIAAEEWEAARRLQEVLRPILEVQDEAEPGDLVERGLSDYARVFGHPVTERWLNQLLLRTRRHDGGVGFWHRLDIYLPDHPQQLIRHAAPAAFVSEFAALHESVARFKDPLRPSPEELASFWFQTLRLFDDIGGQTEATLTAPQKRLKGRLLKFLECLPGANIWLAATSGALRVGFYRARLRWIGLNRSPLAGIDGRRARKGTPNRRAIPARRPGQDHSSHRVGMRPTARPGRARAG